LHFAKQKRLGLVIDLSDGVDNALVVDLMFGVIASAQDGTRSTRQAFEFRECWLHYCFRSSMVL
jgi:hypothetical protein